MCCEVKIRVQEENCFAIEKYYNLNIVLRNVNFVYVKFNFLQSTYRYITCNIYEVQQDTQSFLMSEFIQH